MSISEEQQPPTHGLPCSLLEAWERGGRGARAATGAHHSRAGSLLYKLLLKHPPCTPTPPAALRQTHGAEMAAFRPTHRVLQRAPPQREAHGTGRHPSGSHQLLLEVCRLRRQG